MFWSCNTNSLNFDMNDILDKYWWESHAELCQNMIRVQSSQLPQLHSLNTRGQEERNKRTSSYDGKVVKRRKRRSKQLDISDRLRSLLDDIYNGALPDTCFQNIAKSRLRNPLLRRSSMYVGVSRNGDNWQALINDGNGKKYVGTFSTEEEAGLAYDLYALALQGTGHKTNFGYSVHTVAAMAESYLRSGGSFEPSQFLSRRLT